MFEVKLSAVYLSFFSILTLTVTLTLIHISGVLSFKGS